MDHDRRRDPRFKLRKAQPLEVSLVQADSRGAGSMAAQLIDISRGGAKLALASPVLFNHEAALRIKSEPLRLDLTLTAGMCWARPDNEGGWLLGCAFHPRLPLEVLGRLLDNDVLERRASLRSPRRIPITACWELDPAPTPGYVWDVSEGGFCLLSPRRGGGQVTIAAPGWVRPSAIRASTQWSAEYAGGYIVGCRFLNAADHRLLSEIETDRIAKGAVGRGVQQVGRKLRAALDLCWRRSE